MIKLRVTAPAQRDIDSLLLRSRLQFGEDAAERYRSLILRAMSLVRADPADVRIRSRDDVAAGLRYIHLSTARGAAEKGEVRVKRPRHRVFFRVRQGVVVIERVLHERMELTRHIR